MDVPVLVVGAGPIGLALAGDLGSRGIPCRVLDSSTGVLTEPRMELVGPRTMEFARRWGIAHEIEHCGYQEDFTQDYAWVTGLDGIELGREPFPPKAFELKPEQSPQKKERCGQDMLNPILQRFIGRHEHVEVRYRTEVIDSVEVGDGVEVTARDLDDGTVTTHRAAFLVGCDGAGSTVRGHLGMAIAEGAALTYTNNLIFRHPDLESLHDIKPAYRYLFIGPEGTWASLVSLNGRDRWRFSVIGDLNANILSEDELKRHLHTVVGREFEISVDSVTPWIRREWVAERFGAGRVFLAGDSAHVMSPTGAFGMNTGMGDAVDLAWKLAAVVQGWGGPGLLASYEHERRPVALRNVAEATRNLGRMLSTRQEPPPPEAFDLTLPDAERKAKAYGARYTERLKPEWHTLGISLGYRYDDSPVIWPDGTPAPPDEVSTYTQTARPGARAPHLWLGPDRSTLDLFGPGFTLLRLGERPPGADGLVAAAREAGVPLTVETLDDPRVHTLYERALVLVRPDGHVAWRDDAPPADPGALVERVRGA